MSNEKKSSKDIRAFSQSKKDYILDKKVTDITKHETSGNKNRLLIEYR